MRFELRESTPSWMYILAPISAVMVSLLLASLLIIWAGQPVTDALFLMIKGSFSSKFTISETLARAIPLIFTGLAASIAFKAKFWNIGGEGQLYMGALAVTWLGTGLFDLPPVLMISVLFLAGAIAGGLTLLLPVMLKSKLNVDEVVTTLLLNFVILQIVSYCLEGPLKDPMSMGWPQAKPIIDSGVLPALIPRTRLHMGFAIASVIAIVTWLILKYTRWGFEVRALGINPVAAKHAGISQNATIFKVAMLSGGLAGMAGVSEVAGLKGYLTLDISPGFGYTGIAVAMLASLHPIGVVLSAIFIASVYVGADSMGRSLGIPSYIADTVVATSILSILVGLMLCRYRVHFK